MNKLFLRLPFWGDFFVSVISDNQAYVKFWRSAMFARNIAIVLLVVSGVAYAQQQTPQ